MRQRRIVVRGTLALAAGLAVSACEDPTGLDSVEDGLLLDMAIVAADATLEDLGRWGLAFGPLLSGTRTRTFYNAAGVEQESYDELTTASIQLRERGQW